MQPFPITRRRSLAGLLVALMALITSMAISPPPTAQAIEEPACDGTWCPLATFDDYVNGSLRTQGTWHVNLPGASDGARATDGAPPVFSGRAMINELGTGTTVQYRGNTYAELGDLAVAADATSTLFFEFLAADAARTSVNLGLSADASPGLGFDDTGDPLNFDDFAVQLTVDAGRFVIRDGATDRVVDNVTPESNQLYSIWMVVDNAADTYQVHVATGSDDAVLASSSGVDEFSFRTATSDPLITFLHLNNPDEVPGVNSYLDNIYLNPAESLTNPSPVFDDVVGFEDYTVGQVNGQDGWTASAATVAVAADPAVADNQAMQITGAGLSAHRAIPPIPPDGRGTIFFRLYRDGLVDTSAGLSDVDAPNAFASFEVQANNQNSAVLNARNRAAFAPAGTWSEGVWQCVWMVADNTTDTYRMYSRGGPYPVTTRLPIDATTAFGFRNGTTEALDRFFMMNGASSGQLFVDDIAVDTNSMNLRVPGGDAGSCVVGGDADVPLINPIPEEPVDSDIGLTLTEFVTIPPAPGSPTPPRINYTGELPDGSGRLYVPELNSRLYLIKDRRPIEYLNVAAQFPDFIFNPGLGTGFGFVAFHPEFKTNGLFYTVHTEAGAALTSKTPDLPAPPATSVHGIIEEWRATNPAADTFSGTHREVLRVGYDTLLHGLQQIAFNPLAEPGDEDYGLLYISSGDGEEVPNWTDGAQNLGMPQGKILRIDPRGTNGAGGGYGIPATNPHVGQAGALGEVYARGMRNPHRFSWDPADGRMFLGHIGEQQVESIYEVRPGDNFGWNEREGPFLFKKSDPGHVYPLPEDDERFGFTYPVAAFTNPRDGNAVVGGFVYRGDNLPELRGKYIFTDVVRGRIFYTEAAEMRRGAERATIHEFDLFNEAGQPVTMLQLGGNSSRADTRLGIDAEGELFVSSKQNGKIWRITSAREFASCDVGSSVVDDVMDEDDWAPVTPSKWQFPGSEVILAERGVERPGPRRPFEYAVLEAGPEWGSVQVDADVHIDVTTPTARDVLIVFGYQSDTEFYYAHFSEDNTFPHNGIFKVDNADRQRIDHQFDGVHGAPPAITDDEFHHVRVKHCADTGEIAVYMDGSDTPLMTATDRTFRGGRVGFGSFDDVGRIRDLTVTGTDPVLGQLGQARDTAGELATLVGQLSSDGRLTADQADQLTSQTDRIDTSMAAAISAQALADDTRTLRNIHLGLDATRLLSESIERWAGDGVVPEAVLELLRGPTAEISGVLSQASAGLLEVSGSLTVPDEPVRPGDTFTVDAVVANDGSRSLRDVTVNVPVPAGWTVEPASPRTVRTLAPGDEFTTQVEVTVPTEQDVASDIAIAGQLSYQYQVGTARLPVDATVDVAAPVEIRSVTADARVLDQPGDGTTLRVALENHSTAAVSGAVTVSGPDGWTVEPAEQPYQLAGGAQGEVTFQVTSPADADRGATFDVTATFGPSRLAGESSTRLFFQAASWEFDTDGDAEGWAGVNHLTAPVVAGGELATTSTGGDPSLVQQQPLSVDASSGLTVEVVMHSSVTSGADVYWGTAATPVFSEARRVAFPEPIQAGVMRSYLTEIPPQSSPITQLRVDPSRAIGNLRIDAIRLLK